MPSSQRLDSVFQNSWIAYDALETDGRVSRCDEFGPYSPVRTSVVSLAFVIAITVAHPTSSTVIPGTQLLSVSSVANRTFQGGQQANRYIGGVVTNKQAGQRDVNKYVAYSIPEAYNGKQGEIAGEEGAIVKEKFYRSPNAIVYGSLGIIGIVVMLLSAIVSFVRPLFDVNVAYVLFPLSLVYLAMIGVDYWTRGRSNVLS